MGTRITDLPAATIVNSTDVAPIVQNGTTKQAAVSLIKTTNASDLTSGTVAVARLPLGTTSNAGALQLGTVTGTACEGSDARLSNSRTPTGTAGGDLTGTYPNPSIAPLSPSPAGTYGSNSSVAQVVVDSKGRVVSAVNLPISSSAGGTVTSVGVTSSTLAITNTPITGSGNIGIELSSISTAQLPASGVTPGTYGSTSQIPVLGVDSKGRVTSISTAAISSLGPSGVAAGNYGSANTVGSFSVNSNGIVTGATNQIIALTSAQISGLAASATTDTTNASNISSGTLSAARLATSGVTAATYGSASQHPLIAVDSAGRITGATNQTIAITTAQISGLSASATTDTTNASNITSGTLGSARLPVSGVTAGSFGSASLVPVLTIDSTGRITSASTVSVATGAGVSSFSGGTTGLTPNTATTGVVTLAGTLAIANGGTGATTAANALTSLGAYPSSNPNGYTSNTGTVTSVGGTGTVSGLSLSGSVTTSGNLTLGGTLAVTPSNFASQTANTVLAAPNGSAGVPTFRALVAADVPTLNQNTTGTASNVTGTVAIANGGTGATTQQAAVNAIAGAVTSGSYLRGNGTNVVMSAIQAADVPTLNQNTTGTASNVTGTVAIANGGTGATTRQAAMDALAGAVTSGQYLRGNGTDVVMSAIQAADVPTLNQNTTGTASNVTGTVAVANGGTGATTLTGYVKGSGTSAMTASSTVPATDLSGTLQSAQFPALSGDVTTTAGSLATTIANISNYATVKALREAVTVIGTVASSYNLYVDTQSIYYVTANATTNWSLNISGAVATTLASRMTDGQSLTVVFMATQGTTAYYGTSLTIDGTAVTPKWLNGTAPTSGNTSSIDVYTYTIVRASGAFTAFASRTKFA